jgi:hypothetical protein
VEFAEIPTAQDLTVDSVLQAYNPNFEEFQKLHPALQPPVLKSERYIINALVDTTILVNRARYGFNLLPPKISEAKGEPGKVQPSTRSKIPLVMACGLLNGFVIVGLCRKRCHASGGQSIVRS